MNKIVWVFRNVSYGYSDGYVRHYTGTPMIVRSEGELTWFGFRSNEDWIKSGI
jgi:hypothetical protein